MAKMHRISGSLSVLLTEFKKENITFLSSLPEVILFREEFQSRLSKIKDETRTKQITAEDFVRTIRGIKSPSAFLVTSFWF